MRTIAARLGPGTDLKQGVTALAAAHGIGAGWVAACVGSLSRVALRLAGQPGTTVTEGLFEIVSLAGTVDADGGHLHLAVSDDTGRTTGGHLKDGCVVRTTAEVVLLADDSLVFRRRPDLATGYDELEISGP
jgi:predicted DNA-binding protein with PD1-like motif